MADNDRETYETAVQALLDEGSSAWELERMGYGTYEEWFAQQEPKVAFTKVAGRPKVTIKAVHIERIEDNT